MKKDTRTLLRTGGGLFATGVLSILLMFAIFGGVGIHGPVSNGGWFMLMIAMGCVPLGFLTLALGVAKVFGDRSKP